MSERPVKEWVGRRPESMPTVKVQLRVFDRQEGKCACGCQVVMDFDRDEIDCDHILALKDGGENRETNLQLLRRKCHRSKTSAENTARADAERHKARAFARPSKWQGRGFPPAQPKHNATRPIERKWDRETVE